MQLINKSSKKPIFIIVLIVQLSAAIYLGSIIYQKKRTLGAKVAVVPVDKESTTLNPESVLENFYEPVPNSSEIDLAPWLEGTIEYFINSDTLRESKEYEPEKPDNTFRIITLGDSFTFGASVYLQENYPKQLETQLNNMACSDTVNFEVINLGVRGYDAKYAVERFRLRGGKYSPDLILWLLKDDDFFQIEEIMRPLYISFLSELEESNQPGYQTASDGVVFYPWYRKALKIMRDTYSDEEIIDYQLSAMKELDNYYDKQIVILTFSSTKDKYDQVLIDYADSKNNAHLYMELTDPGHIEEIQPDGHPTPKGYSLMAEEIINYLERESLIPCD